RTKKTRAQIPAFTKEAAEGMMVVPVTFRDAWELCSVPSSMLCSDFAITEACQAATSTLLSRGFGY
ncbi:hypothetical protein H4S07_006640, partial [Coemansia furcata]